MIQVIKKYPLQYKVKCDQCGKEGFINKKYFDKFGFKHKCLPVAQETSGRLEIPEPHKESLVPFEVIEVVDNNPEKHIETEKIIKKKKK